MFLCLQCGFKKAKMIRNVKITDASTIANIYNHYILNTNVTFEEVAITADEMKKRISATIPKLPWMVFEKQQEVIGYAYASNWKGRIGYRFSFEISVYLKDGQQGQGIGTQLYATLIDNLIEQGAKNIIGGVALPNPASVRLHEKLGFKKVAHYEKIGVKFGEWIDVAYWQLVV